MTSPLLLASHGLRRYYMDGEPGGKERNQKPVLPVPLGCELTAVKSDQMLLGTHVAKPHA